MRLIYERELIARISELPDLRTMNTATIGKIIKACSTIDAVEVVRCKDCVHWQPEPMGDVMMCYGGANGRYTAPDWFCADGRRKDNDG